MRRRRAELRRVLLRLGTMERKRLMSGPGMGRKGRWHALLGEGL